MKRSWFGPSAPLAFTYSALLLGLSALVLPFVTVSKFGNERISYLSTGAEALMRHHLWGLGTWVLFCGVLAPFLLLLLLLFCIIGSRSVRWKMAVKHATRLAEAVQEWAMPEVHVLAVLVAFFKLGDLVDVNVGPAFGCYAAAAILCLLAWRSFSLAPETVERRGQETTARNDET